MVKYLRTEYGIYEVIREILGGEAYEVKVPQSKWEYDEDNSCYYEDSKLDAFYKKDILKQSDSIEELCNMFVLKDCDIIILNKEHTKYHFEGSDEWFDITDVELRIGIYGAIWTDKGLTYVAKMNERGELELL